MCFVCAFCVLLFLQLSLLARSVQILQNTDLICAQASYVSFLRWFIWMCRILRKCWKPRQKLKQKMKLKLYRFNGLCFHLHVPHIIHSKWRTFCLRFFAPIWLSTGSFRMFAILTRNIDIMKHERDFASLMLLSKLNFFFFIELKLFGLFNTKLQWHIFTLIFGGYSYFHTIPTACKWRPFVEKVSVQKEKSRKKNNLSIRLKELWKNESNLKNVSS